MPSGIVLSLAKMWVRMLMSPGRSATCMILPTAVMAEQRGGCHHYKYHPKSPPRVRRCSCFRVECRSSKTASVRRHPSVDSLRPSRGSKGSIHRPPNDRSDCCVLPFKVAESQDDRRMSGVSSDAGWNLLGRRGRAGSSRPLAEGRGGVTCRERKAGRHVYYYKRRGIIEMQEEQEEEE